MTFILPTKHTHTHTISLQMGVYILGFFVVVVVGLFSV